MSFTDVVTGQATLATNVNQLVDALNGSVASQVQLVATSNATWALQTALPSAPSSDQSTWQQIVAGDSFARMAAYIRSSDGYGGIRGGAGSATQTAHMYAQSNGWKIDESMTIVGALTVQGTASFAGVTATGTVAAAGVTVGGLNAATQSAQSAHPINFGMGPTLPTSGMQKYDLFLVTPFS